MKHEYGVARVEQGHPGGEEEREDDELGGRDRLGEGGDGEEGTVRDLCKLWIELSGRGVGAYISDEVSNPRLQRWRSKSADLNGLRGEEELCDLPKQESDRIHLCVKHWLIWNAARENKKKDPRATHLPRTIYCFEQRLPYSSKAR